MEDTEDTGTEHTNIAEMLELQLIEVEMLQSMFANPGEFTLDSQTQLEQFQAFVDGTIGYDCLESRVGFTIKFPISTSNANPLVLELVCNFPHKYPSVLPEMFTRAPDLDRPSHSQLREDLGHFIASLHTGHILVGSVVDWLRDHAHAYIKQGEGQATGGKGKAETPGSKEEKSFQRLWIYSHHIYSKFKRRDICDWAWELGLKGFSLPGKPGVICVEGGMQSVEEFWYRIRRMNWKRIMIKEQEIKDLEGRQVGELCVFSQFQELDLDAQAGKGRNYHMNLGKFYEFLQKHDMAHIFTLYFGVEGRNGGE